MPESKKVESGDLKPTQDSAQKAQKWNDWLVPAAVVGIVISLPLLVWQLVRRNTNKVLAGLFAIILLLCFGFLIWNTSQKTESDSESDASPEPTNAPDELAVSPRLREKLIKSVDFKNQTIEFKNKELLSNRRTMKIKKTGKNKLWKLLERLLTQTEDDGWVTLSKQERNWHGLFRRTAPKDKTRTIVDPTQDPVILGFHIFADKSAGDAGPTKIRLEAKCERGKYRSCVDKYNRWLQQKRTKAA